VIETGFEQSFPAMCRLAAVRATRIVSRHGLPCELRRDLEQEAVLEVWRKRTAYNPERGSWRTFSEHVVANKLISIVRTIRSKHEGQFKDEPLENLLGVAGPKDNHDLRADVSRILARVSSFDRAVARSLVGYSAAETGRRLDVSRATIYRAIERLRAVFTEAGLSPERQCRSRTRGSTAKCGAR
jgi:RNA polymerase sigma factor (sigma-70 family)